MARARSTICACSATIGTAKRSTHSMSTPASAATSGIERGQATVGAGSVAAARVVGLVALLAVAQTLGLGDGGEQLLVERHEVARLRAFARAEDETVKIGREPDEVEFLHART